MAEKSPQAAGRHAEPRLYSNWTLIRRMLAITWRYRARCMQVLTVQIVTMVFLLSGFGGLGLGIDVIRYHAQHEGDPPTFPLGIPVPTEWSGMQSIVAISIFVLLAGIMYSLLRFADAILRARLVLEVVVQLRQMVYDKLQRLSFRFFDNNDTGSMINRVTADVQAVRMFIEFVIVETVALLIALTFFIAYMLSIHVWLTVACLGSTVIVWFLTVMFSRAARPAYQEGRELHDKMTNTLSENLLGVRVVKGFARQKEQIAKFTADNDAIRDKHLWIWWRFALYAPSVEFLTWMNWLILLGYGGWLTMNGQIPLGSGLVVFAAMLQAWTRHIGAVSMIANSVQRSVTGAQRVFEVMDTRVEVADVPDAKKIGRARGEVKFEHVTFGYDPSEPVLHDVELHIKPGTCVAVLGATGAGKSSLLSLIPRFYDPQCGRVLLDGDDLRKIDLEDLRRNVGIVFQESFLFSTTAAANIAFGHPEATYEQVEKAATIAQADEFLVDLPNGYHTIIGENGVDLSGGQRQRLAIARAILLEPAILLLDDPTAAVDPDTEHQILEAMDSAMKGRTTFVIAHRLSTLRRADIVIVLDGGRITQRGTHRELMARDGHYREIAMLQVVDDDSKRWLETGAALEVEH